MSEPRDELWLYSPNGDLLHPGIPLSSLEWWLEEGKFGVLRASGPLNESDPSFFALDTRFQIHRFLDNAPLGVEGNTQFFNRYWSFGEAEGGTTWNVEAYTPEEWLVGRYDYYDFLNGVSKRSDYADDMVKGLLYDNTQALANLRAIAELSIEPDLSLAPTINLNCSSESLASCFQSIAAASSSKGTPLYYGFVKKDTSGSGFTFKTWINQRGIDHTRGTSDEVIVSQINRNLAKPKIEFDHRQEVTVAIVIGKGWGTGGYGTYTGAGRLASPVAYRETKIQSAKKNDADTFNDLAEAELEINKAKIRFTGTLIDTDYARYGLRVFYGDKVTAEYMGLSFACLINRVHGKYAGRAETLEIGLTGEAI